MDTFLCKPWTMGDIEQMGLFYETHMAPLYTQYPWPRDLFEQFVKENAGWVSLSPHLPTHTTSPLCCGIAPRAHLSGLVCMSPLS